MKKICLIFLIYLIGSAKLLFASIEIEPMRLELELDAGKVHSGYISLTNHGKQDIELSLSRGEYRYMFSKNTIYPQASKAQTLPSCKNWITFDHDRLKLKKGQTSQVQYAINAPAVMAGEYVAAILIDEEQPAEELKPSEKSQVRIKITPRISIPVYIAAKNSLRRSCIISDLSAALSSDKKSAEIYVTLKNTGTVHVRPATSIVVLDEYGILSGKFSLGKSLPLFPDFGEKLSSVWKPRFSGRYTIVATVDIGTGALIQKSMSFEVKK